MAEIPARAVLTERARAEAARQVGQDNRSVAAVARDFGVGWETVMRAVRDVAATMFDTQQGCSRSRPDRAGRSPEGKVSSKDGPSRP